MAAYEVGGSRVIVPQRVDPERHQEPFRPPRESARDKGELSEGAEEFIAAIPAAPAEHQAALTRLADWAIGLEQEGLVRLRSYQGKGRWTLLPRLHVDDVGLVTVWNDGGAYLSLWRSVFERRAPRTIDPVERAAGVRIGSGNVVREISDELLEALTLAYREAATA